MTVSVAHYAADPAEVTDSYKTGNATALGKLRSSPSSLISSRAAGISIRFSSASNYTLNASLCSFNLMVSLAIALCPFHFVVLHNHR